MPAADASFPLALQVGNAPAARQHHVSIRAIGGAFILLDTEFLSDTSAENGLVAADRLSAALHITHAELATALGLSRDAVSKASRARTKNTQARLRAMVEIINRVRPWAGSTQAAFAWYRSQPLPSFGDQTAEALLKEGRADAVRTYLDRIAVGGYA
jgi:hypothetical protein